MDIDSDETKIAKRAELLKLLDRLQVDNLEVKHSMGAMLIGWQLAYFGTSRIEKAMADKLDRADLPEFLQLAAERMQGFAAQGFHLDQLLSNLREVEHMIMRNLRQHKEAERKKQDLEMSLGLETPFPSLNRQLGGGLKPGVLLVHGENAAVFPVLAQIYKFLLKRKVPITHLGTADKAGMPEVPGVQNIPGAFWKGQGSSLTRMKNVFDAIDGRVVVVDRLDWLTEEAGNRSASKSRQLALKCLAKVAKRCKISVVVGHVTQVDEEIPSAQLTQRVSVSLRRLSESGPVLVVGEDLCQETSDGIRVLGSEGGAASGVAETAGRTEGSEQLEGPGEDSGEDRQLGGGSSQSDS